MNNNTRTVFITAIVVLFVLAVGYLAFTNPASPLYPGTGGASSSMSSVSSVPPSSASSVSSAMSSEEDVSSAQSSSPRSSAGTSSVAMSGSSSSFEQSSPRETVSRFYLEWATYGGFINNELAATSPFLTERMRTSVDSAADIFCNDRQPMNFTTVLLSKGDSEATVQVNERYANGVTVSPVITVRSEDQAWRIDGVTCPAASSSSTSSL